MEYADDSWADDEEQEEMKEFRPTDPQVSGYVFVMDEWATSEKLAPLLYIYTHVCVYSQHTYNALVSEDSFEYPTPTIAANNGVDIPESIKGNALEQGDVL